MDSLFCYAAYLVRLVVQLEVAEQVAQGDADVFADARWSSRRHRY